MDAVRQTAFAGLLGHGESKVFAAIARARLRGASVFDMLADRKNFCQCVAQRTDAGERV